jgi:signal transduction histidine kinase
LTGNAQHQHKKRLNWRGFSLQLFLIMILPLTGLMLAVVFGSQMLHRQAMRSMVADRDLRTVQTAAAALEGALARRSDALGWIAADLEADPDTPLASFGSGEWAGVFDGGLAFYATDGTLRHTTSGDLNWSALPQQQMNFLETLQEAPGQPVFSGGLTEGLLLAGWADPQGTIIGAFSVETAVQAVLGTLISSGQVSLWVLHPDGDGFYQTLYTSDPLQSVDAVLPGTDAASLLSGSGGVRYDQNDSGQYVVAASPVPAADWWLVMEEAWVDIASPSLSVTQSAPLILVPVFLLALVALWFGASRIIQPLQELEEQASRLATGDFEAAQHPVGGIEEIRNLQAELASMAARLKSAQSSQRSYIGAITSGVENERRNLARELHDDTIQSLIALNQRIQLSLMNAPEPQKEVLIELQKLVQGTMVNLRRLIRGLRPIYLEDLGLTASLKMLVREMEPSGNTNIDLHVRGDEFRLDPQVEMSLYRMVQESLSNVLRHADASQAWIDLVFSDRDLTLHIRDNGKGFVVPANPAEFPERGHFGLLGLQERSEILCADLSIVSTPREGTTISIRLEDLDHLGKERLNPAPS